MCEHGRKDVKAKMSKLRAVDLFAGIGGIRLGFDRAFGNDIETVFVSEWDKHAQLTYKENFQDDFDIAGDITKIREDEIPQFDICLAGFPCQAFSLAGQRKGFNDNYKGLCRGTLFQDVARICEYHRPKVIFCENVKGLFIHDRGRTFGIICKTFEELGYKVFYQVLNSKDFGVPQNRERIYIVAFRNDIAPKEFKFPSDTDSTKRIKDIIEEEAVSAKYYLSEVYLNTLIRHKARHEAKGNGFGYEIRGWNDLAGAIVCGGMGRERNLIVDKRQSVLIPTTHIKGEINKDGIRKMTPREWARLQGFPDTFKLSLADVHLYRQLGNSVTVNVIEAIASEIRRVITMPKGNKGEWSELYAFFKLLSEGRLYGADSALNRRDDIFYNILQIIRNEQVGTLYFVFDGDNKKVRVENNNGEIEVTIGTEVFGRQAETLLKEIKNTKEKSSFEVIETSEFMKDILCSRLKAPSANKSDITIMVHDTNTGLTPTLGFSIKSRLGKPSTLLNASTNTNFIYSICGNMNDAQMDCINSLFTETEKKGVTKKEIAIKARMAQILNSDLTLSYADMNSKTFKNNLVLIDSDLPIIVSQTLLEYYLYGTTNILEAINAVSVKNPLGYDLSQGHEYYHYKFKKLLTEAALGMLPGKVWTGRADASGGYIIVKEDGDVLCYHLYNRNDFEDYLLNNTRFERGGADRHDYAVVKKVGDEYRIALNLQVRFIK